MKMHWLSYIFPRIILRTSSRYNHDIRVIEERGEYKLLVNGSRQSGKYIRELWKAAFRSFHIGRERNVKNILVLGVAGGTVIHLLRERYPRSRITGVDIDPVMIDIGRQYFGLDSIRLLRIIQDDARRFIRQTTRRFDLVIVDLFLGRRIPAFVQSVRFLGEVKTRLQPDGRLIINYLREAEHGKHADKLFVLLQNLFSGVSDFEIMHNRFFLAI